MPELPGSRQPQLRARFPPRLLLRLVPTLHHYRNRASIVVANGVHQRASMSGPVESQSLQGNECAFVLPHAIVAAVRSLSM